jgi:hypothetical protein
MRAPGGGLFGSGFMIDIANGTMLSYNATAIDRFSSVVQNTAPSNALPNLASAVTGDGVAQAVILDQAGVKTLSYPAPLQSIDAVSAVLAADSIYNDFVTDVSTGAASEWVVTFPTKHFYTDNADGVAIRPFQSAFPRTGTQGTAPQNANYEVYDRNGAGGTGSCTPVTTRNCILGTPPPDFVIPKLPWSVNVLTFNQGTLGADGSAIFGSNLTVGLTPSSAAIRDGSMRLKFIDTLMRPDQQGTVVKGLPAIGFWASSYVNAAAAPGLLANYSGLTSHKSTTSSQ